MSKREREMVREIDGGFGLLSNSNIYLENSDLIIRVG